MSTENMLPDSTFPPRYSRPSSSGEGAVVSARQKPARQGAEDLSLSYYESPLADGYGRARPLSPEKAPLALHKREFSVGSTSSSDYSTDSSPTQQARTDISKSRRRSSISSEGGADRRRLAIIQLDSPSDHSLSSNMSRDGNNQSPHTLRSRRGIEAKIGDLALVAPPDASPRTYTQLTPPSTAPISGWSSEKGIVDDRDGHPSKEVNGHHRSASEAATPSIGKKAGLRHKGSRDVGIVGTSNPTQDHRRQQSPLHEENGSLKPPIFQIPKSRSPSPADVSDTSDTSPRVSQNLGETRQISNMRHSTAQPFLTSDIGQEKTLNTPVASVVVNLSPVAPLQVKRNTNPLERETSTRQITLEHPLPFSPVKPMSYVSYQPGVHSTAGPLPPPPRATLSIEVKSPPPPRPPRLHSPPPARRRGDIEAVKQALQLPPSVFAVLAKTPPPTTRILKPPTPPAEETKTSHTQPEPESPTSTQSSHKGHRREGAFPPSTDSMTLTDSDAITHSPVNVPQPSDSEASMNQVVTHVKNNANIIGNTKPVAPDAAPSQVVDTPAPSAATPEGLSGLELSRSESWININLDPATPVGDTPEDHQDNPSPPRNDDLGGTPSPPPKSLRHSWTRNLKRFSSLPRTPSSKSLTQSNSSHRSRTSRTPSPSTMPMPLPKSRPRTISPWPTAMFCGDVVSKKTAVERCAGYIQKINELYVNDCGLNDWVAEARYKGTRSPKKRATITSPSSNGFTSQARQTSGSSMISEVTFPRRSDATTATDLSARSSRDVTPPTAPPPLPYPSLAQVPRAPTRSSSLIGTPPSSLRSLVSPNATPKSSGGFFASLGRKASLKKNGSSQSATNPTTPTSSSPSTKLVKSPHANPSPASPVPRPINISTSPSVPGGPRAPPNRILRSQTMMISAPLTAQLASSPGIERSSSLAKPTPQNGRTSSSTLGSSDHAPMQDCEFSRQVDKLADLLPQADRVVLAGYLRRAGQDILAIGQYLEDEKNGTIRKD